MNRKDPGVPPGLFVQRILYINRFVTILLPRHYRGPAADQGRRASRLPAG